MCHLEFIFKISYGFQTSYNNVKLLCIYVICQKTCKMIDFYISKIFNLNNKSISFVMFKVDVPELDKIYVGTTGSDMLFLCIL